MAIEVREPAPKEHEETGRVTAAAYREFVEGTDWEPYLARIADVSERAERTLVLVAVEDGRIIGSVTLELDGRTNPDDEPPPGHEAHIRMLGVHPDARGRGAAKALMAACESRAKDAGRTRITLNTTMRMEQARQMYGSLGYVRGQDEVFPDGFVLLSYFKDL
jgi:ribosomal protein S18 acetylase RimI-like enzyme